MDDGSASRVMTFVQRFESFGSHMGVNLRGAQAAVTEQQLDDPEIGIMINKMRSERMSQCMG